MSCRPGFGRARMLPRPSRHTKGTSTTSAAKLRISSTCATVKVATSHLPSTSLTENMKIPSIIRLMPRRALPDGAALAAAASSSRAGVADMLLLPRRRDGPTSRSPCIARYSRKSKRARCMARRQQQDVVGGRSPPRRAGLLARSRRARSFSELPAQVANDAMGLGCLAELAGIGDADRQFFGEGGIEAGLHDAHVLRKRHAVDPEGAAAGEG